MTNLLRFALVFSSALTIIVADSIIKKVSVGQSFFEVLKDPWIILVYALYFIQILFAVLIFIFKGELAIYTNLFIIFYGIFGVVVGILYFKESLTPIQAVGIFLGLLGAVLINL